MASTPDMRFGQFLENCSDFGVYNVEDEALADFAEALNARLRRGVK